MKSHEFKARFSKHLSPIMSLTVRYLRQSKNIVGYDASLFNNRFNYEIPYQKETATHVFACRAVLGIWNEKPVEEIYSRDTRFSKNENYSCQSYFESGPKVHIWTYDLTRDHKFRRDIVLVHFLMVQMCAFGPDSKYNSGPKVHLRSKSYTL